MAEEQYERKLRPVYDALDARSWKQAAKLADAVLKKHKGDQLLRALKGYAVFRCGKADEALQLMRELVGEGPDSDRVAMTMTYTYKAAGQLGGITQAYVAAAEKHPKDPEIVAGLFRAHVREFDFVKQQQAAMRLSKLAPTGADTSCYTWWIVCSLALQARAALLGQDQQGRPARGAAGLPPEKLLQLAETMAGRQTAAAAAAASAKGGSAAAAASGWTYEALLLYLDVLQGQGKASAALQTIEGPLGDAVPLPADRLQLRAAALVRAGDLAAAAAAYRQALTAAPDDWLSWQLFLDCLLPGSGVGEAQGGAGARFPVGVVGGLADAWDRQQAQPAAAAGAGGLDVAAAVAAAEAVVSELTADVAARDVWRPQLARGTLRAPHLWRCELLLRRLALAGSDEASVQQLQHALRSAVAEAFAHLAGNFSCAADLRPYLARLRGGDAVWLAAEAHATVARLNADEEAGDSGNGTAAPDAAPGASSNGGGSAAGEVRRLQRLVNAHQLETELGLPELGGPTEGAAHARRLLELYRRHMHLSAGLDEKERGYGEELVTAAVEALMRGAAGAGVQQRLAAMVQGVLALEAAQRRRKVSAPLRLAATALYSLLGASKLASAQFAALDIKSVLHDSMTGHWLLPLAAAGATGGDPELRRWADGCAALHDLHQQEAGETLGTALQHGTYSKAPEFVDFKERVQHSHARALAAVLQAQLPEKQAPAGAAAPVTSLYNVGGAAACEAALRHAQELLVAGAAADAAAASPCLRFNDDLSTRPSWYPPGSAGSGAVADWWRQPPPPQGYAACWWAAPQAAEGGAPEAAAWRQRSIADLRTRVAWALATSASLVSVTDATKLLEQVEPLLTAGSGQDTAAGHTDVQAMACAALLAVLQALAGSEVDLAAAQHLAAACRAAREHLVGDLAAAQGFAVLPGSAVVSAAAFVADGTAIAAFFGKLKKLAAKLPGVTAAAGAAADAATTAVTEVQQAVRAAAAAQAESQRVAATLQLLESSEEGSALWAFEPEFDPQPAVLALVKAQLDTLQACT